MSLFEFRAIDRQGQVVEDRLEAPSIEAASGVLEARGLTPLVLKQRGGKSGGPSHRSGPRLARRDLAVFSRQFSVLLRSGLTVAHGLETISRHAKGTQQQVLTGVGQGVQQGEALSEALARYPGTFNRLYVATIGAAERVGALPVAFRQLGDMLVWEVKLRRTVRAALQYPTTVVAVVILAVIVLLRLVVPQFSQVFATFGGELPLATRLLVTGSDLIGKFWWVGVLAIGGAVVALRAAVLRPGGRLAIDRMLLAIPGIGGILLKMYLARFSRMLGLMQANGLPILTSLEILGDTVGNAEVARSLALVRDEVGRGDSLAEAVSRRAVFSSMVKNMIRVGEESGMLDETLKTVSEFYDEEIDASIRSMTQWIEPVLTVVLGGFILFLALAIFLPWWDLTTLYKN